LSACPPAWWPGGLEVNNALARLERVGNIVHVRDMSTVQKRRAARRRPA
jgi:hypothetical protein